MPWTHLSPAKSPSPPPGNWQWQQEPSACDMLPAAADGCRVGTQLPHASPRQLANWMRDPQVGLYMSHVQQRPQTCKIIGIT